MRKLSLDLVKVAQDARTIAAAATMANAEGQIAAVESRSELLGAVGAVESILEALRGLQRRSEDRWRTDELDRKQQERAARLESE